jgi:hypothetical protein
MQNRGVSAYLLISVIDESERETHALVALPPEEWLRYPLNRIMGGPQKFQGVL